MSRSDGKSEMANNGKHPGGAPKGSRNHESHGLVTFRNKMHKRAKRRRSIISLRSGSGQNAIAVQMGLTEDLGGIEHLSTAKKVLIEMVWWVEIFTCWTRPTNVSSGRARKYRNSRIRPRAWPRSTVTACRSFRASAKT